MSSPRRKSAKRSFQPLQLVLIGGGVSLLLFFAALLVAKAMLEGWLRGEGFREWLSRRASQTLKSEVSLAGLEWNGSEVYTSRFEAQGRSEAAFSRLVLEGIRARPRGMADRAVQVPDISVDRLDLLFSPERTAPPSPERGGGDPAGREAVEQGALPDWLAAYLPNRVELGEVSLGTAQISVHKPEGEAFLLRGSQAKLQLDSRTGVWSVEGRGGKIRLPSQPELALKELRLRWKERDLFLDHAALGVFERGHVRGQGEIQLEGPGHFDLELELSAIDVDDLLKGPWRERLAGTVSGPLRVSGAPGSLVYEGTVQLSDGIVEGLPLLQILAKYTRSARFERLVLNEARSEFRREGDRLELRDLVLQSDGLARIEGRLELIGEELSGEVNLGVVPGMMLWIPGAERLVFTEERRGFRWAPVKLSGTRTEPKEDLSARLIAAAGESVIEGLPEGLMEAARQLLGPSGSASGAPPPTERLPGEARRVLDLLSPLLNAP